MTSELLTSGFSASEATIREAIAAGRWLVVRAIPPDPELPDLEEGETTCLRVALPSSDFRIAPVVIHAVPERCWEPNLA